MVGVVRESEIRRSLDTLRMKLCSLGLLPIHSCNLREISHFRLEFLKLLEQDSSVILLQERLLRLEFWTLMIVSLNILS